MLDDQIVRLAAIQHRLQVLQPLGSGPAVDGVHDSNLLVQNHIGIIGYPVGDWVLALKQVNGSVVRADIADGVRDMDITHRVASFLR